MNQQNKTGNGKVMAIQWKKRRRHKSREDNPTETTMAMGTGLADELAPIRRLRPRLAIGSYSAGHALSVPAFDLEHDALGACAMTSASAIQSRARRTRSRITCSPSEPSMCSNDIAIHPCIELNLSIIDRLRISGRANAFNGSTIHREDGAFAAEEGKKVENESYGEGRG